MKGTKVLIADDEVALAELVGECLREIGMNPLLAVDGKAAIQVLQKEPSIPLLISDIRMPRMDGYELVRRAMNLNPEIKVVLMTGYHDEMPPKDVLSAREFRFLRKPVSMESLQALVTDMISRP
jgi:DNA-binding NtrC family response regulator